MEKDLVLIGGGGHCKSVIDVAKRMNCFDNIVITDPSIECGTQILGCTVVGTDDCLESLYQQGFKYAFITIGNVGINPLREKIAEKLFALGYKFPVIQDPSANVSDSAVIEEGTFVGKNVVVNSEVKIGRFCIINTGAIIEHECCVEDFTHISVGAAICGNVNISKNCMVGARSTVIQGLNIGSNSIVGAGAVVINDLPDNCTAVGIPARIL